MPLGARVDYSLNNHAKHYNVFSKDVGISLITGLSGAPYALRHLDLAKKVKSHALGHRVIAVLEMIPVIGALAALIERIVAYVKSKDSLEPSLAPNSEATADEILDNHILVKVNDSSEIIDYHTMTNEDLQVNYENHLLQIQKAYERSIPLRKTKTSVAYSEEVLKVETSVERLEEMHVVLKEKDIVANELSLVNTRETLQKMYQNMPVGDSIPLKLDKKLFQRFSEVPSEKTYRSPLGTFENLTTSPLAIKRWFDFYITKGYYDAPGCNFRTDEIAEGLKPERKNSMFTLVRLYKSKDQIRGERKNNRPASSSTPNNLSKFFNNLFKGVEKTAQDNPEGTLEVKPQNQSIIINLNSFKKHVDYGDAQDKVFAELERNLPAMMDVWNFDGFEFWTTEKLLKYNLRSDCAHTADIIVLYHKKVSDERGDITDDGIITKTDEQLQEQKIVEL